MAKPYFSNIPDFEYVSRVKENRNISEYITVKNLFKRGKLREEIFANLNFFTKYSVIGDERPDNVAYKIYNDETLDWVVLISNNILNIRTEWPLPQTGFDRFLIEKYKVGGESEETTYNRIYNGIHHYESSEIKNTLEITVLPKGLQIPQNFSLTYYDAGLEQEVVRSNIAIPVTNYEYEIGIQEKKRNIFILKPKYLNVVYNDLDDIMPYKQGSEQYVSRTLKRADNIRLYQ
jgi:hypothetical protein